MAAAAVGTGIQASQNAKALQLASDSYNKQRASLLTDLYANPLDSVSNKALLSSMDRRLQKQEQKVENMAAASGATFENTLAAKQASNEAMADIYSSLLQNEQVRKDAYKAQLLNLGSQRTAQQIAAKQAAGQAWANMGSSLASSLSNLGGSMYESGNLLSGTRSSVSMPSPTVLPVVPTVVPTVGF
jgi:hypothetical protein